MSALCRMAQARRRNTLLQALASPSDGPSAHRDALAVARWPLNRSVADALPVALRLGRHKYRTASLCHRVLAAFFVQGPEILPLDLLNVRRP